MYSYVVSLLQAVAVDDELLTKRHYSTSPSSGILCT